MSDFVSSSITELIGSRDVLESKLIARLKSSEDFYTQFWGPRLPNHAQTSDPVPRRKFMKLLTLGILYGMGPQSVAQQIRSAGFEFTDSEARARISEWFAQFPEVRTWMESVRRKAAECGYVETIAGRRRYFPSLMAGEKSTPESQARARRQIVNTAIQGSAADLIQAAGVSLRRGAVGSGIDLTLTLQLHDELIFEVPSEKVNQAAAFIRRTMREF